jgi:hypothetical protein
MVMVMGRRPRHLVVAVVLAAAIVLAPTAAALADTSLEESGRVGPHAVLDTRVFPGVTCDYDDGTDLVRLRVRAPTVFARDRTEGRDQQWVGWRLHLRFRPDGGTWSTIKSTTVVKVRAWEDTPAALRTRSVTTPGPAGSGSYRIYVRMIWYQPGSSTAVQGFSLHRVERYTYALVEGAPISYCPGGIL